MGTTTKMAIPYPEATGLVKDGWEDMKDIATQVDAKSGLILINTTNFSAVNSVSIPNDTFTSAFKNYRIIINVDSCSSGGTSTLRLRAAGTDATGTNYDYSLDELSSGATTYSRINGVAQTSIRTGYFQTGERFNSIIDVFSPKETSLTTFFVNSLRYYSTGVNAEQGVAGIDVTTAYDAITFINPGITGSINVYGYNV